jgi:hypothetical protein
MEIDECKSLVLKPVGCRTPAAEIDFHELLIYKWIYDEEIDTNTAHVAVQNWIKNGRPVSLVADVLYSIIVEFGEGFRIWGKFEKHYTRNDVQVNNELIAVFNAPDVFSALNAAKGIRGLGESYASKVLRFVSPNYVVLDSILRDELCGQMDYTTFRDECDYIAQHLNLHPVDIEASLFAYVQIANPCQRKRRWRQYR